MKMPEEILDELIAIDIDEECYDEFKFFLSGVQKLQKNNDTSLLSKEEKKEIAQELWDMSIRDFIFYDKKLLRKTYISLLLVDDLEEYDTNIIYSTKPKTITINKKKYVVR
jgi:hypothetical protein